MLKNGDRVPRDHLEIVSLGHFRNTPAEPSSARCTSTGPERGEGDAELDAALARLVQQGAGAVLLGDGYSPYG
jgi:hypothetical protein